MRVIVIVPTSTPGDISRIDRIVSFGAFHVAIGKEQVDTKIVAVTGALIMLRRLIVGGVINYRVQVGVKIQGGGIRADIPNRYHVRGLEHLRLRYRGGAHIRSHSEGRIDGILES